MPIIRSLFAFVILVCAVGTSQSQEPNAARAANIQKAIEVVFAEIPFSNRGSVEDDLNGDGQNDVIAIVHLSQPNAASEFRLLVLAGGANDSFIPLSVSGDFCSANKFYDITTSPVQKSFEVKMVGSADATHAESFTLKFRHNAKLNDFELVGWENLSNNYDEQTVFRESFNYLTKMVTVSRHLGKNYIKRHTSANGTERITNFSRRSAKYKEVKVPFNAPKSAMLQGFDCFQNAVDSPIYITEDFQIQKK